MKFQSTHSLRRPIRMVLLGAILFVSIQSQSAFSDGTGFTGRLAHPSSVVSESFLDDIDYREPTIGYVAPRFLSSIRPHVVLDSAMFSPPGLRSTTTIYKNTRLISRTDDAYEISKLRYYRYARAKLDSLAYASLIESKQSKRRSGVSLGVALPKKLDRLFGEGGGNLQLTGSMRVNLGAKQQYTDGSSIAGSQQQKGFALTMDQVSRFEMSGTIGTKISVRLAQDNKTNIPLANRIQIRYKGDDDDIIKSIEAGNTNLSLPNTQFVGYSSQIQGLFGFKTEAVLGDLALTAIASQEKGSSEKSVISADNAESAQIVRDYQYAEGRLFDIAYLQSSPYSTSGQFDFLPGDSVIRLEVYESRTTQDGTPPLADFYINPDSTTQYDVSTLEQSVIHLDLDKDYDFEQIPDSSRWVIHFRNPKLGNIGLYYEFLRARPGGGVDTIKVGDHSNTSGNPYKLKYLRGTSDLYASPDNPAWRLMWRNVYAVPKNSRLEDLNIRVYKGSTAQQGTDAALDYQKGTDEQSQGKLIAILGLDQYTASGVKQPDDKVDDRRDIFRSDWGLLIFPSRTPFSDNTKTFTSGSGAITKPLFPYYLQTLFYDKDPRSITNGTQLYYIQMSSRTRSSIIRLNRTNIIEGSERVILNGVTLSRDADYKIQYDFGQITLTNESALDPNADLRVEFEYAPFLSLAKKTLLGARADYRLSKDARIGTTMIYKSDKAQDRKPRVGQETSKATVFDVDGSATFYPKFISSAINALPFISSTSNSTFNIVSEYAQSNPDPNVLGEAFIDDFEGATEQISIGTTHTSWTRGTKPITLQDPLAHDTKMLWYNPGGIPYKEVYNSDRQASEGTITPLFMIFRPSNSTYSKDTAAPAYSSIMRYFGNRVDESRLQLFEMRVKGNKGVMHFDFGGISEDLNGDNRENTEDADLNGAVDESEDTGIDGLKDDQEVGPDSSKYDPVTNPDPDGDDFYFKQGNEVSGKCPLADQGLCDLVQNRYEWVNGTEGNRKYIPVLGRPDREALGPNGFRNSNNYFSFTVDLSDTLSDSSFYVPGSRNDSGWVTYRIPIRDPKAVSQTVGTPHWDQITHLRVWREASPFVREPDTIAIANWYFVQAYWQDTLISKDPNARFVVATVSQDENTYDPPSGVGSYKDPTTGITEPQKALSLSFANLAPHDTGFAIRRLLQNERYTGYNRIKMYVHGPNVTPADSAEFIMRLGTDSLNYYEYSLFLDSGWNTQNYVDMDFQKLTELKDSLIQLVKPGQLILGHDGRYGVRGQPSLNDIGYFSIGVVNASTSKPLTGEVWVDELRVTDPRRDPGKAFRANISGTGADLFSYSLSYENRDAYFRSVSSATRGGGSDNLGSGSSAENISWQGSMNVDRFLPKSWGASLPISFSQSEATSRPLLRTGTDIVLPEAIREAERSFSRSRRLGFSESFRGPNSNPLFSAILNRQKVNVSITQSDGFSVTQPYRFSDAISVTASYDLGIKKFPRIPLFFWTKGLPVLNKLYKTKLQVYPTDWTLNANFDRSISITQDPGGARTSTLSRGLQGRMSMSLRPFENLNASFRAGSTWDMAQTDSIKISLTKLNLGRQTAYDQNIALDYDPKLLKWFTAKGTYTANYNERLDQSSNTRRGDMTNAYRIGGTFAQGILFGRPPANKAKPQPAFELPGFIIEKGAWFPPLQFDSTQFRRGWQAPMLVTRDMLASMRPPAPEYPFYDGPFSVMRGLLGWLKPVSYGVSFGYNNSTPGMRSRPSWGYRFGLQRLADVSLAQIGSTVTRSETFGFDVGSGARFFGGVGGNGLAIDIRYKYSQNNDLERLGTLSRTISRSRPEFGITLGQMPNFPIFRKLVNDFIAIFAPRTGFGITDRTQSNLSQGGAITSHSISYAFNPLIGVTFRPARDVSLATTISSSRTISDQFNVVTSTFLNTTKSNRNTVAVSAKYSFSSPSGFVLPLFGRIRFNSQVSISVDATMNRDKTITETPVFNSTRLESATSVDKKDFTVRPVISYQFSSQIQGGISGQWIDNSDLRVGNIGHVREITAFVEIHF